MSRMYLVTFSKAGDGNFREQEYTFAGTKRAATGRAYAKLRDRIGTRADHAFEDGIQHVPYLERGLLVKRLRERHGVS